MKQIDKIAWIELKNKSILSSKSFGKDVYYLPGGKRDEGETDEQTLVREIFEELNVKLIETSIRFFGIYEAQAHGHEEGVLVKMTCYTADYTGKIEASAEIEEVNWLNYADMDKISEVDKLIFNDLKEKSLLD